MNYKLSLYELQVWHCTQHSHQMDSLGSFVSLKNECLKQSAQNKGKVSRGQKSRWNQPDRKISIPVCRKASILGKIWSRQSCQGQRELGIETCWGRASGRAWADPGSSISLYTSFPMSCKLLSTYPHTGKHSIWRTHAPVSQITLEWWCFCSFEKDSSFETLKKC